MKRQMTLIELTDKERIEQLKKYTKHGFYCCWVRDRGVYDKSLGCTCGLAELLESESEG